MLVTACFFQLSSPATKGPPAIREVQKGRLPRVDRDYFRELETQSLTEMGKQLRQLVQNVDQLTQNVGALS